MKTFWDRAEQYPPVLCRLLARLPYGRPLADAEIAEASGLSVHQVFILSQCTNWVGIDIPTAHKFLDGCGINFEDPEHMDRVDDYLRKKPSWKYLRLSPHWASFYQPLMLKYKDSRLQRANNKS